MKNLASNSAFKNMKIMASSPITSWQIEGEKVEAVTDFIFLGSKITRGFPGGSDGKSVCLQCGRPRFDSWVRKIPWRKKWQPTPVLLPGKFHGWRNLIGYSPWGRKELDTTEGLVYSKRIQFRNSEMEEMCRAKTYGERTRALSRGHSSQISKRSQTQRCYEPLLWGFSCSLHYTHN